MCVSIEMCERRRFDGYVGLLLLSAPTTTPKRATERESFSMKWSRRRQTMLLNWCFYFIPSHVWRIFNLFGFECVDSGSTKVSFVLFGVFVVHNFVLNMRCKSHKTECIDNSTRQSIFHFGNNQIHFRRVQQQRR